MNTLAGIRVLDLSRLLPGPFATLLLANMGAEVIKIERPPEGDYTRAMPPYLALRDDQFEGVIFAQNNQNKASVAIDFDDARGRELVLRMCEHADVFVESFRPGALKRRGLDYAAVHARNPKMVYCSLSGYGQSGPYAHRAGHDLNYMALAGIQVLNGARGQAPVPMPVLTADLAAGMRAALEIVAALVARQRTGEGAFLDVGLFDAAVEWMQTVLGATVRVEGETLERGNMPLTGAYPCYNIYETADGAYMALGALEPIFWRAFCVHAGCPELIDSQFDTAAIPRTAVVFRERSRAAWTEFSLRVDCCLEPLLEVRETLEHPQVKARNLIQTAGRVPRLGEDTAAVLSTMGIGGQELQELFASRVIGA